jgi:GNAT superfamily N-acetyltransferase
MKAPVMIYREATIRDIPGIQIVRNAVKENRLSDPSVVTDKDCEEWITVRGKGWVCVADEKIIGFAIADLVDNNIWALFVDPGYEKMGIGGALQAMMLKWYFSQTKETVWLGTAPLTKAESFYRKSGWTDKGVRPNGEIRFELTYDEWKKRFLEQ